MMVKLLKFSILSLLFFTEIVATVAQATPILIYDNNTPNQLIGVDNVAIGTDFYNVSFIDGSAASLFSSGFTFTNYTEAYNASNALSSQVFNGLLYTGSVTGIKGIDGGASNAWMYTPYATKYMPAGPFWPAMTTVDLVSVIYESGPSIVLGAPWDLSYWATSNFHSVYAVWEEAAPVPEPATMLLFGIGLLGFAGVNRKNK